MIRTEIIRDPSDGTVFIKRYMLWFTKRVCINVIYKDYEHMHSHPWNYATVILYGGYKETVIENDNEVSYDRKPGYVSSRTFTQFHKISPLKDKAITLFFRSNLKAKFSKFLVNGKIMPGAKYWLLQGKNIRQMFDSVKG